MGGPVGVDVGVKVGEGVGTGVNVAAGGTGDGAAATARSAAGRAAQPARHRSGSRTASSSQTRRGREAWIRMRQVRECRFKVGVSWQRPTVRPLSVGGPCAGSVPQTAVYATAASGWSILSGPPVEETQTGIVTLPLEFMIRE